MAAENEDEYILWLALNTGNIPVMRRILDSGSVDINVERYGHTLLTRAIEINSPTAVVFLLEKGIATRLPSHFMPLLFVAVSRCRKSDVQILSILLEKGAVDVTETWDGLPIFTYAIEWASIEAIELLAAYGAPLFELDPDRQKPLDIADDISMSPEMYERVMNIYISYWRSHLTLEQQIFLNILNSGTRYDTIPRYIIKSNREWLLTTDIRLPEVISARERMLSEKRSRN